MHIDRPATARLGQQQRSGQVIPRHRTAVDEEVKAALDQLGVVEARRAVGVERQLGEVGQLELL